MCGVVEAAAVALGAVIKLYDEVVDKGLAAPPVSVLALQAAQAALVAAVMWLSPAACVFLGTFAVVMALVDGGLLLARPGMSRNLDTPFYAWLDAAVVAGLVAAVWAGRVTRADLTPALIALVVACTFTGLVDVLCFNEESSPRKTWSRVLGLAAVVLALAATRLWPGALAGLRPALLLMLGYVGTWFAVKAWLRLRQQRGGLQLSTEPGKKIVATQ